MGMEAQKIKNFFYSGQSFGVNFMGYIAGKNEEGSLQSSESRYKDRAKVIGGVDELPYWIKQGRVEEIYWSLPEAEDYHIEGIINLCEKYMVRFYRVPHFDNLPFKNFDVNSYSGLPVLHYRKEPLENIFNKFIKRVFDLAFSFLVIVLILSWLTPLVWSIMKFTMPGPVFFAQDRSGKDNKTFKVLKFRSMKVNNSSDKVQATKGDSRITPFGRFLRKSSIDEMPQFINVFLGQMTVTGPRPHMLKHTEEYSEKINTFMVRHLIKPGITGWAQVNGFRGGTENLTQMQGRVEHDVWYLENWNFWLDMRIIVKTIKNTIRGEDNAY
jgi:putative colanic acid biosynthesis UDP-glucose lipid carrier transferase